jgi:hypothetical protein
VGVVWYTRLIGGVARETSHPRPDRSELWKLYCVVNSISVMKHRNLSLLRSRVCSISTIECAHYVDDLFPHAPLLPVTLLIWYMYMYILQWNPSIPDTLGTALSVLIKGGVIISGVVLYTLQCSWGHAWCPD